SRVFRTFFGASLICLSSSCLFGKRAEQRFRREITPLAPLRTRDVSQSRRDQHQRRVSVGKCSDNARASADLADDPLERVVGFDLSELAVNLAVAPHLDMAA